MANEELDNLSSLFSRALEVEEGEASNRQLVQLIQQHMAQTNAFLISVQREIIRFGIGEHGAINCGPRGDNFTRIRGGVLRLRTRALRRYTDVRAVIQYVLAPVNSLEAYDHYRNNEAGGECTNSKQALNRCISLIVARMYVCFGFVFMASILFEENDGDDD